EAGTARVGAGTRWKDVIEASPRWSSTWSRWPVSTAAGSSTRPRCPRAAAALGGLGPGPAGGREHLGRADPDAPGARAAAAAAGTHRRPPAVRPPGHRRGGPDPARH